MKDHEDICKLLAALLQVLGNAKGVVAAVISILIFRNPVTLQGGMGYALALLGIALYSRVCLYSLACLLIGKLCMAPFPSFPPWACCRHPSNMYLIIWGKRSSRSVMLGEVELFSYKRSPCSLASSRGKIIQGLVTKILHVRMFCPAVKGDLKRANCPDFLAGSTRGFAACYKGEHLTIQLSR